MSWPGGLGEAPSPPRPPLQEHLHNCRPAAASTSQRLFGGSVNKAIAQLAPAEDISSPRSAVSPPPARSDPFPRHRIPPPDLCPPSTAPSALTQRRAGRLSLRPAQRAARGARTRPAPAPLAGGGLGGHGCASNSRSSSTRNAPPAPPRRTGHEQRNYSSEPSQGQHTATEEKTREQQHCPAKLSSCRLRMCLTHEEQA